MNSEIKRGTKVKIPKGTQIYSTHPDSETYRTAKRNQVVTVHHTIPAYRHLLAHQYPSGNLYFQGSCREQCALCEELGLPFRTDDEVQASLYVLVSKATVEPYASDEVSRGTKPSVNLLWLERRSARVCWVGAGGYWCEAPLSVVQVVTPIEALHGEHQALPAPQATSDE